MQSSSSSKYNANYKRNFIIMLFILFFMEFARGMFVLGYLPFLPTVSSVAVGVTSAAVSIHYISDAATNFVVGFLLKRFGAKPVLTLGFLLAFGSLFLVIWFPYNAIILIMSSILLGVASSPIWVIMLSSVRDESRGKQMGHVYFAWLFGLLAGMIGMLLIVKVHPTHFTFLMALVVLAAWILYYFVKIRLTNYKTRRLKEQLAQIKRVAHSNGVLFPGIILQGASISALVPILPTYATKVVKVSMVEYTAALIIGGVGCAISMLFLSKIIDHHGNKFMFSAIFTGFVLYTLAIFSLSLITQIYLVWGVALFIGLMYGFLLPAWNTFMAKFIKQDEQEEPWGVFNSIQGVGAMIGPLIGGMLYQFTNNLNMTFYFSGGVFVFLAIFYGIYFLRIQKQQPTK
ncbi:MFS transporter [Staphylococcus simulans]|uniref:lipoteichoic acid biosynthesis MFS flippase LtaA n=1 Tax=Staphylococcus simulans TaxID=1286 RepID=UPI000D1ED524|nr:MFS transporter [Staphylococcus simulans]PTJ52387.1 MFS transporter [Staphylococcus simulans]